MEVAVAVNSFVTARAKAEVFKSAGAIVEKVISTEIDLMARLLGVRILYIFCPCWRGAALERLWKARPCLLSHAQRPGTNRHVRHVVSNLCSRYVTTEWSCELVLMRRTAVRNK